MDMENVLMTRDGIMNVEVNFSDGIVQVLYDAAELTEKKVHELVEELGFKSKILSSEKI
jgi:copper chaperone CopZ